MKRNIVILAILLCCTKAFPQTQFGIVMRCSGQADFAGIANCGSTLGIAGLGVMRAGILEFSLGVGYSYKLCSNDQSVITDFSQTGFIWETWQMSHRMHFLDVPFVVSVQCWRKDKFCLRIYNELEYNRLCCNVEFVNGDRRTKTIEKWGDIPREAVNGLTYRLGLTASYDISKHLELHLSPFFGVKAILNQYEPIPTHFPSDDHSILPDHRFSSGVIIGMEYVF